MLKRAPALQETDSEDDPVICPDGRQSPAAASLQRGVCRTLRSLGFSVVTELVLAGGRRADVVGLSPAGDIWMIEIKSCLADFQADSKWAEYFDHCDRLYFAVAPDFPHEVLPQETGMIFADRFGAEIMREPQEVRLSAARRKAMTLSFARAAALRLQKELDPFCVS